MSTAKAQPNGVVEPVTTLAQTPKIENPLEAENAVLKEELRKLVAEKTAAPKPIDSYFTPEHQGMIAAKYRAKYSDVEQEQHKKTWQEFAGNHFTLYLLAETLLEAKKAVYSANRVLLLNSLTGAMVNYTATAPGAVLTELQVVFNKTTDMQLIVLRDQIPDEVQRTDLLKAYSKNLKQAVKSGKDLEVAKAKFFHAASTLGILPNTIW